MKKVKVLFFLGFLCLISFGYIKLVAEEMPTACYNGQANFVRGTVRNWDCFVGQNHWSFTCCVIDDQSQTTCNTIQCNAVPD